MIKLAVIGHPVSHSLSPVIHGWWIKHYGLDAIYDKHDVAPKDLGQTLDDFRNQGYRGLNVTIPHKSSVIEYLSTISDQAKAIGAVNILSFNDDGIVGDNSDGFGFLNHLDRSYPDWRSRTNRVLVIGAGGAALAIVDSLVRAGIGPITITNRNRQRAEQLTAHFNNISIMVMDWPFQLDTQPFDLIVQSSAGGMSGVEPLEMVLNPGKSAQKPILYDIVYDPDQTDFLRQGLIHGFPILNGLGMLVEQARMSFFTWFGFWPRHEDVLIDHLKKS